MTILAARSDLLFINRSLTISPSQWLIASWIVTSLSSVLFYFFFLYFYIILLLDVFVLFETCAWDMQTSWQMKIQNSLLNLFEKNVLVMKWNGKRYNKQKKKKPKTHDWRHSIKFSFSISTSFYDIEAM